MTYSDNLIKSGMLRLAGSDLKNVAATFSTGGFRRKSGMEAAVRRLLLGGVFPIWLGAGAADWYLHRRTRIEETSGPRESLIHQLMFAETGVPVLLGLFCEVNAGTLGIAYSAVGAHSLTAMWDQAYAEPRRRVSLLEQHVHSLLEISPVMAAFLLTGLHWDQARALIGRDERAPRFSVRFKRHDPLTARTRFILLAAVGLLGVLPYAEELYRCWRTNPTVAALAEPGEPATQTLRLAPDSVSALSARGRSSA